MTRRFVSFSFAVVCLAVLSGCGSGSPTPKSTTTPTADVAVSLSANGSAAATTTLNLGQSLAIVAVILNDTSDAGVKWSLSGQGSLGNESATSATYTAPSSLQAAITATVTATSAADSTKSASLQITVNPPIVVTLSPSAQQWICVDQTIALSATVSNDPKNAGVEWGLTGSLGSNNGLLTNETTTGAVYNTPTGFNQDDRYLSPIGANVTATSVTDPSKSAQLSIVVTLLRSYDGLLPSGTFNQPYSFTVPTPAPCGKPPYTWSAIGGLPPGLSLSGNVISGVPTYPDNLLGSEVVLAVSDSQTPVPNTARSVGQPLVINLPTVLSILTSSLPQGSVGSAYNQTLLGTAGTPPYIWSISGGNLPSGLTINSASGAITGVPTANGTSNFTVRITDSATPLANTATSNFSITIQPQLAIQTTSLPPGSVGSAYAQPLLATGGVPPYSFSLQNGNSLPAGLSLVKVIAGVPATTGTSNFTIIATDSQGATATGNLGITITAANCPNNSSLQGNYAFLLSGPAYSFVTGDFYDYVGSFVADGQGNVTQGYIDSESTATAGAQPGGLTGTYCVGANNIGTLTLNGFMGSIPPANTFEVAIQGGGNGSAILYENPILVGGVDFPAISGVVLKQDTTAFNTAKITGNYGFELLGGDTGQNLTVQTGVFTADGAGDLSDGDLDVNYDGTVTSNATFSASGLVVTTTGRGTVGLSVPGLGQSSIVFYVVNATQLLALEVGPNAGSPTLGGQILQQSAGPFTNSSLNGVSVVGLQSRDSNDAPVAQIGVITWDGGGSFIWSADQNDAGIMSAPNYTGTYSVSSNGRVTLSVNGQMKSPVLYLTGENQGFVVGSDIGVASGSIFNQTGTPFSASSFAGSYFGGNWQTLDGAVSFDSDGLTSDGSANITGTSDTDLYSYGPASNSVSGTYAVSGNGRGTITQNGSVTNIFYVISPTQILMLPSGNPNPNLVSLSH